MNEIFSTQAGNFTSALYTKTDPRTGQFMVNLPLVTIVGNNHLGPNLNLGICYSPLNSNNQGFGKGFSLGVTRFDNRTNLLELSSGEQYRVEPGTDVVRNQKLVNFRLAYANGISDAEGYIIFWKDGHQEHLTFLADSVFTCSEIISPLGRRLTISWGWNGSSPLLDQVEDEHVVLCSFTYINSPVMTVWPGTDEEYQVIFDLANYQLSSVTRQISDSESVTWGFNYDFSFDIQHPLLNEIKYPTGMTERVDYSQIAGLQYPDASGIGARLPVVLSHTRLPGAGQPETTTQYEYTTTNFLGYEGNFGHWSADSDYIYTTLTDYRYGSTETIFSDDVKVITTRTYNNYHQMVSEERFREGCTYRTDFTYYAEEGIFIDGQPPQFQLVREKHETWTAADGKVRTQLTLTEFDESGNPVRQLLPDGTEILTDWYSSKGEDGCPSEPNGFVRFMKLQETIPFNSDFDAPSMLTRFTYVTAGDSPYILQNTVKHFADDTLLNKTAYQYNTTSSDAEFGRITSIEKSLYPTGEGGDTFTSHQAFTTLVRDGVMRQTTAFTGHDGLKTSTERVQSALSGLLLSETDAQGVTVTHAYDKLGRPLTRTVAPGTEYENTHTWAYSIEDNGPVTTETDTSGNQLRIYFDGAGRSIRQQRLDSDNSGKWFDVFQRQCNSLGEFASGESNDWLTIADIQKYGVSVSALHDGWGEVSQQAFSDGTTALHENDPVGLSRSAYMTGLSEGKILSTGRVTTIFDETLRLPVKDVRTDSEGKIESEYFRVWDGLGRLRSETDEVGNKTERSYDEYGRVLVQILPDGSTVTKMYAPHLTGDYVASISMTGPDKYDDTQTWLLGTQKFDSLGRVTEQVCGGRTTTFTYHDASFSPASVTLPSGKKRTYRYIPELNNAISRVETEDVVQTFTYDSVTGKPLQEEEGRLVNNYLWAVSGGLEGEQFAREGLTSEAGYTNTLLGAMESYADITGSKTVYERDTFGRVSTVNDGQLSALFQYDALGRLSSQEVVNNQTKQTVTTTLAYDDFGREVSRIIRAGDTSVYVTTSAWTRNGLLATRDLSVPGTDVSREEKFGYDSRNRLVTYSVSGSEPVPDAYGNPISLQTYKYDALNNLVEVTTTLTDQTVDITTFNFENESDPTQLTSLSHTHSAYPASITLEYDAEGRMTRDEAGRHLAYDSLGRLSAVSGQNIDGGTYGYDARNRLTSQTINEGQSTQLYYRGPELVNEVSK